MIEDRIGTPLASTRGGENSEPLLLAPLRIEAAALRLGGARRIERVGMGPQRAEVTSARLRRLLAPSTPIAVIGFGGGLSSTDRPGDVVVASEIVTSDGSRPPTQLDAALVESLHHSLRERVGSRVRAGRVLCTPTLSSAAKTAAMDSASGALCCEMESAWLAPLADRGPFAVIRVIVDRPGRPLAGPWTLTAGLAAFRRLATVAGVVAGTLRPGISTTQ